MSRFYECSEGFQLACVSLFLMVVVPLVLAACTCYGLYRAIAAVAAWVGGMMI